MLDAVAAASGEIDAALLTLGSLWDFAAPSLIVAEAGGVFRDAWGGTRFDTHTAVITNTALLEPVLDVLSDLRPPEPDKAVVARTVSVPIGTEEEQAARRLAAFGIRPLPSMSARDACRQRPTGGARTSSTSEPPSSSVRCSASPPTA